MCDWAKLANGKPDKSLEGPLVLPLDFGPTLKGLLLQLAVKLDLLNGDLSQIPRGRRVCPGRYNLFRSPLSSLYDFLGVTLSLGRRLIDGSLFAGVVVVTVNLHWGELAAVHRGLLDALVVLVALDGADQRVGLALCNLLAIGVACTVGCEPDEYVAIGVGEVDHSGGAPVSLEAAGEAHGHGQSGEGSSTLALVSSGELAANLVALLADVLAGRGNLLLLCLAALTIDVAVVGGDCGGHDADLLAADGVQATGHLEVPEVVTVGVVSDRPGPLDDGLGKLTVAVGHRVGPLFLAPCLGAVLELSKVPVNQGLDDVVSSGEPVAILANGATTDEATELDGGSSPGEDAVNGVRLDLLAATQTKEVVFAETAKLSDELGIAQDAGAIGIAQVVLDAVAANLKLLTKAAAVLMTNDEGVIATAGRVAVLAEWARLAELDAQVSISEGGSLVDQVDVLAVVHLGVIDGGDEAPAVEVDGSSDQGVGTVVENELLNDTPFVLDLASVD